jgi:phosphoribosylaminoimidazole (AIR) synthetase
MLRTFNMGIGLILAVAPGDAEGLLAELRARGETEARPIGRIEAGEPGVRYLA